MSYKNCFVPMCRNTTHSAPEKMFFSVPKRDALRQSWFQMVRRDLRPSSFSSRSSFYCCQDHFDIEKDVQNLMFYRMMKERGQRVNLKLRPGVRPTKFTCQPSRLLTGNKSKRTSVLEKFRKLENKKMVDNLMFQSTTHSIDNFDENMEMMEAEIFKDEKNVNSCDKSVPANPSVSSKCIQAQIRPVFRSRSSACSIPMKSVMTSPLTTTIQIFPPTTRIKLEPSSDEESCDEQNYLPATKIKVEPSDDEESSDEQNYRPITKIKLEPSDDEESYDELNYSPPTKIKVEPSSDEESCDQQNYRPTTKIKLEPSDDEESYDEQNYSPTTKIKQDYSSE